MNEPIIVVSAAIVNVAEKRLFMQRRSGEASSHKWHWVTPGGKQKPREQDVDTLYRELQEEHGVIPRRHRNRVLGGLVYEHNMVSTTTGRPVLVRCYYIDSLLLRGEYKAGPAVAGFDWVSADELETLMLGPADSANLGKLLELIR